MSDQGVPVTKVTIQVTSCRHPWDLLEETREGLPTGLHKAVPRDLVIRIREY